ncbi:MAG: hypothetical protein ABIA59_02305 [Candidatus Latescibacterota bacterium]
MKRNLVLIASSILACSLLIPAILAKRADNPSDSPRVESRMDAASAKRPLDPQRSSAAIDTFILGDWTFDGAAGGPDPQGWYGADRTLQPGPFFPCG